LDNFAEVLSGQGVVKELPKNGVIKLQLYDVENHEWVVKKSFVITKGKVVEGSVDKLDMDVMIDLKYLPEIGNNLCDAVRKAGDNNELAVESDMGKIALLWKYKSMLKYRRCLGF
jgi:hypothetical protein